MIGVAVLMAGLLCRAWLTQTAIKWGYVPDHFDNIGTGATAEQQGLLKIYSVQPEQLAQISGFVFRNGTFVPYSRKAVTLPNYPPLYVVLRWVQVKLLRVFDPSLQANTMAARLIMPSIAFIAELITAWGVFLVVRKLFSENAGYIAAAILWLFPPVFMNSAFWEQVDALVLAPTVFLVWFMLERRWIAAGVCLAVGAMLKPQGILLGPIALFGIVSVAEPQIATTWRLILMRGVKVLGMAVLAIVVIAWPWMAADGLAWIDRCYIHSFLHAFPRTTLSAFNIWYVDALIRDHQPSASVLDSQTTIAGLSKDIWGRILVLTALVGTAALCWRKYRQSPLGLLAFAGLWLWSDFMLPTRVHERFIIYCMPLIIILAFRVRALWPAVLGLLIVGAAEMSHNVWLTTAAGRFSEPAVRQYYEQMTAKYDRQTASLPPDRRPELPTYGDFLDQAWQNYRTSRQPVENKEILFTLVSLGSYVWALITLLVIYPRKNGSFHCNANSPARSATAR